MLVYLLEYSFPEGYHGGCQITQGIWYRDAKSPRYKSGEAKSTDTGSPSMRMKIYLRNVMVDGSGAMADYCTFSLYDQILYTLLIVYLIKGFGQSLLI